MPCAICGAWFSEATVVPSPWGPVVEERCDLHRTTEANPRNFRHLKEPTTMRTHKTPADPTVDALMKGPVASERDGAGPRDDTSRSFDPSPSRQPTPGVHEHFAGVTGEGEIVRHYFAADPDPVPEPGDRRDVRELLKVYDNLTDDQATMLDRIAITGIEGLLPQNDSEERDIVALEEGGLVYSFAEREHPPRWAALPDGIDLASWNIANTQARAQAPRDGEINHEPQHYAAHESLFGAHGPSDKGKTGRLMLNALRERGGRALAITWQVILSIAIPLFYASLICDLAAYAGGFGPSPTFMLVQTFIAVICLPYALRDFLKMLNVQAKGELTITGAEPMVEAMKSVSTELALHRQSLDRPRNLG